MRYRTKEWTRLAARGRFNMDARAVIAGKEYFRISAPKISHSLAADPLSIGNCNAASLKMNVLLEDGETLPEAAEVKVIGRLTDLDVTTQSEVLPFGTYWIDICTQSENLCSLTCYDAMLKTSQAMTGEDDTAADWPKPMADVVRDIAYRIGVPVDPRTQINEGPDYTVPYPDGYTMQQVLGWIGACHGGNWTITEEGQLRLVPLTSPASETCYAVDEDYETAVAKSVESLIPSRYPIVDDGFNEIVTSDGYHLVYRKTGEIVSEQGLIKVPFVIGEVTKGKRLKVSGILMTDDNGNSFAQGDDSGFVIEVDGCPCACQGICNDLYSMLHGIEYEPFAAPDAVFDPATELGDQVKIGNKVNSVIYSMDMELNIGYSNTISAPTNTEATRQYPYLKGKDKKIEAIEDKLENAQSTAEEAAKTATNFLSYTDIEGLIIRHVSIPGKQVQITNSGVTVTNGTSSVNITSGGISITDGKGSCSISAGSITFNGLRQNELWTNSKPSDGMAAGSRILTNGELNGYSAVAIGFGEYHTFLDGSGVNGSDLQFSIFPINGVTAIASRVWDYPRVRTVKVLRSGITFGQGGFYKSGTLGVDFNKFDTCCVPCKVYGFM